MKLIRYAVVLFLLAGALASCEKDDQSAGGSQEPDQTFAQKAVYANLAEIDAGKIAAQRGNLQVVRMFGDMMVNDHSRSYSDLKKSIMVSGFFVTEDIDPAHRALGMQLMSLSGRAFDSTYMRNQVMDHQMTINLLQSEIASGMHTNLKEYAIVTLPVVMHHKMIADSIVAANHF